MESIITRNTAVLLAAATQAVFPNVQIYGGGATAWGFFYDFIFPFPFQENFLPLIEEKMRILSKQNLQLQLSEMIPSNAAEYLRYHGQEGRAEQIEKSQEGLIKMVHFGSFFDVSFFEEVKTSYFGKFKLLEALEEGSQGAPIRLIGACADSKEELKVFLKSWVSLKNRAHQTLCQQNQFLTQTPHGWVWLPKGEAVRQILLASWKKWAGEQNFELVTTPSRTKSEMLACHTFLNRVQTAELSSLDLNGGGESLLNPERGWVDQLFLFSPNLVINCLQSIEKFLKIFPFDYEVVLCGKKTEFLQSALDYCQIKWRADPKKELGIEFCFRDLWGQLWAGPSIKSRNIHKNSIWIASFFASMERFFALLLEKTGGVLPFWLAPEQLRIINLSGEKSKSIIAALQQQGWRLKIDAKDGPLGLRMHDALQERVPFSIVLGEKEFEKGVLSVRAYGASTSVEMTLETLTNRLKKLENQ